jgi:hypothetical protein
MLLLATGCADPLRPAECSKLLDRYTELLLGTYRPDTTYEQRQQLRRKTLEKATEDPEFLRCPGKVSRSQFDCAMQAVSVDDMERCLI